MSASFGSPPGQSMKYSDTAATQSKASLSQRKQMPELVVSNDAPIPPSYVGADTEESAKMKGKKKKPVATSSVIRTTDVNTTSTPKISHESDSPHFRDNFHLPENSPPLSIAHSANVSEIRGDASKPSGSRSGCHSPPTCQETSPPLKVLQCSDNIVSARLVPGPVISEPNSHQRTAASVPPCNVLDNSHVIQVLQNIPTSDNEPQDSSAKPCWKKHGLKFAVGVFFLLGFIMVVVGVLLGQKEESDADNDLSQSSVHPPQNSSTTTTATSSTSSLFTSSASESETMKNSSANLDITVTTPGPYLSPRITTTAHSSSYAVSLSPPPSCVTLIGPLFEVDCADICYPQFALDGHTAVVAKSYESISFFSVTDDAFKLVATIKIDYAVHSVSVFDEIAVVGAPFEDNFTGAIHIFEGTTSESWEQTVRIVPKDIMGQQAWFGRSIDLYEDVFVVGAPYDWEDSTNGGSAYTYRRAGSTWKMEAKLVPTNATLDQYGTSVSITGNAVAVGDFNQVFVFFFDLPSMTWKQYRQSITNTDCESWFGVDVHFAADKGLLIGCEDESSLDRAGAVYYYNREGAGEYILQQKITSSDNATGTIFGGLSMIARDGDVMVVGTRNELNGKAYVLMRANNHWEEIARVNSPHGSIQFFGFGVAFSHDKILIYSYTNVYGYSLNVEYC